VQERTAELQAANAALQTEITERKQAEVALQASHDRTRAIVETALDAIITMDEQGRIVDFNPAAERIFGQSSGDVIGQPLAEVIIPPDLRVRHRRGLAHYLATGEGPVLGKHIEMTGLRADGSLVPLELTICRMPGAAVLFTSFLRDIAERKRAEETLRESEERYRLITENTGDIVMLLDQQGRFTYISPSCRQVLGYEPTELIGASGFDLVHPEDLASALEHRPELASSGATQLTCRYRHADGSWRWLEARGTLVTRPDGYYTVAVGQDITERREAEMALQRLNDELEQRVIERTAQLAVTNQHLAQAIDYPCESCR
jgi:PAS domain S-box-containing protein